MRESWKRLVEEEKKEIRDALLVTRRELKSFVKWLFLAFAAGLLVGAVGSLFSLCLTWATNTRKEHEWILYLLPLAGILIVFIYQKAEMLRDGGTNTVLDKIRHDGDVPFRMMPLIFIATVLTHLCGGSAGREGAALQIGGSMGNFIGKKLRLDDSDKKVLIMCGMSAAFAALFGTPMAAVFFALEVATVGIMYYSALFPCAIASLTGYYFSTAVADISPERLHITEIPSMGIDTGFSVILIAAACAFAGTFFCWLLHKTGELYQYLFHNAYIRIAVAGLLLIVLTLLEGSGDYNGAGMDVIERAFEGEVVPWAFLLKMIFTALTLGAGYRGGEIVPSFFIGATLGAWLGSLLGLPASISAGVGLAALFCGVTNCPISTLFICFELFQYEGVPFFLLAIAVSYLLSGYSGLYQKQKMVYSKYHHFLNPRKKDNH
ncbi:MAG: chloride channel protein [Lachnospiraceae bacterium]|nr:chloride channel protein [Lachnospiraceae bacterium]